MLIKNLNFFKQKQKKKFRHRAIFPVDSSKSIVAATTFHNHVRNGDDVVPLCYKHRN